MSELQPSVLLEQPREVSVGAIEHELTQLWKAAEASADGGIPPVVRACTLNLIVFAGDVAQMDALADLVGSVTAEHPSRIFLVGADRSAGREPSLDAWISARCTIPLPGEQQVCCEQISFVVYGNEAARVPSLITSLLVPDIPTVLLWKAAVRADDRLFDDLLRLCDRVIIDSSEDLSPLPALRAWATLLAAESHQATLGDLAWTHVTPWRLLLAQAFQPADARRHLSSISTVTLAYSTSSTPRHSGLSQSLLMTAWLAGALGWEKEASMGEEVPGAYHCVLRQGAGRPHGQEREIRIALVPAPAPQEQPGGIEHVTVECNGAMRVDLAMMPDRRAVRMSVEHQGETARVTLWPVRFQAEPELIARELEMLFKDALYEESLRTLQGWFTAKR